jgi:hypothetical protein
MIESRPMSAIRRTGNVGAWIFVLQSGLVTTAAALLGVWLLQRRWDVHLMGSFFYHVIPVGAIIVGLVASIGYVWASWFTGLRINRLLLVAIVALHVSAYFAAHYIKFRGLHLVWRDTGEPLGFWHWFHLTTMAWRWRGSEMHGEPLGYGGYAFRLLEIAGFVGGVLLFPWVLSSHPYCRECQRYQRRREFGYAPEPEGRSDYDALQGFCTAQDAEGIRGVLSRCTTRSRAVEQSSRMTQLTMAWCPCCLHGQLNTVIVDRTGRDVEVDVRPSMSVGPTLLEALKASKTI